jgi:hypothetical protein
MLMEQFEFVFVYYVRRSSNVIAHKLVGLSRRIGSKAVMLMYLFLVANEKCLPLKIVMVFNIFYI